MINKIEDIYPLTIIALKYGKFAILQHSCRSYCANSLENHEEWQDNPHGFMKNSGVNYGIGNTIAEAFEDFKMRLKV